MPRPVSPAAVVNPLLPRRPFESAVAARLVAPERSPTEPRAATRSLSSQDPTSHVDGRSPAPHVADDGWER
jgi:hypothetical protein